MVSRVVRMENEFEHTVYKDTKIPLDSYPDQPAEYEELTELLSDEQKKVVHLGEAFWVSILMVNHMPLFFKALLFPFMLIYYSFNKEKRRKWIKRLSFSAYVSIDLIRSVWNLPGLYLFHLLHKKVSPLSTYRKFKVACEKVVNFPAGDEQFDVNCYLFCDNSISTRKKAEPVQYESIVLHFHGGGFCASSVRGHEAYLRKWAKTLHLPIISVDYSLAPEFPFPRAFNECVSVYKYLLTSQASEDLGIKFNKIILAGDSAGGNMVTAVTLWTLENQVKAPDGLMLIYPSLNRTPTLMNDSVTYLRNDPVLPLSFRMCYTVAYISSVWNTNEKQWNLIPDENNEQQFREYFVTPLAVPSELLVNFPNCCFITGDRDPLWNDTVQFFNMLQAHSNNFKICYRIPGVSHGFFGAGKAMPQTSGFAFKTSVEWILKFTNGETK